ncbi:hypothetical protein GCM10009554_40710 [Kribbella koreensis]|uniref:Clp R domain-containing protein n=1 Tax=Kribbella koreensis TaxID=57909 RepID=A0ABP4B3Q3_9ACTN
MGVLGRGKAAWHAGKGNNALAREQFDRALEHYRLAIALAQAHGSVAEACIYRALLAGALHESGDDDSAVAGYELMITACESVTPIMLSGQAVTGPSLKNEALEELIDLAEERGDKPAVVSGLRRLRANAVLLDRSEAARAASRLGDALRDQGDYEAANRSYQTAAEEYQNLSDVQMQGVVARCWGRSLELIGDLFSALDTYQAATEYFERTGDKAEQGLAHVLLGELRLRMDDHDGAYSDINVAKQYFEAAGDLESAARAASLVSMFTTDGTSMIVRLIDRCSSALRTAISDAKREAVTLGATELRPEHLLVGVLDNAGDPLLAALERAAVDPVTLRAEAAAAMVPEGTTRLESLPFGTAARHAVHAAREEADEQSVIHITTLHVFLALTKQPSPALEPILSAHGLTYESLKRPCARHGD